MGCGRPTSRDPDLRPPPSCSPCAGASGPPGTAGTKATRQIIQDERAGAAEQGWGGRPSSLYRQLESHPETSMAFNRYIGIDYSGARTPTCSLKGLRVYVTDGTTPPEEVQPPPSPRKYWTRREVAEWLADTLSEGPPTLVGIDHAFSFPLRYFEVHLLPPDWSAFLDDFQHHWPTDGDHIYVDFIRDGSHGDGAARTGNPRWRRLTEERAGAKSVFHFDVPGSMAKSTHAGLPWLRFLRRQLGHHVWFWPFDGWDVPEGRSCMVEVYPLLWSKGIPTEDRTGDQYDAFSIAEWMRGKGRSGRLRGFFTPSLTPQERTVAQVEGWILGLM